VLRDLEFVQFHPTAMAVGRDPMPLATETLRGEGAVLVTAAGERVMADHPQGDLAPRDVIARAVWRRVAAGEAVFLDARPLGGKLERFARVIALCREAGLDPTRQPIPIRPAAHYHMGGVAVDGSGRSSVPGLWAAGEVAATGLHGANRLASNSLLEALATAGWIAEDIRGGDARPPLRPLPLGAARRPAPDAGIVAALRGLMERHVGVVRDGAGLVAAITALRPLADAAPSTLSDRALAGLLIATAALRRRESRGAQCRSDRPAADPASAPSFLTLADVLEGDAPRTGTARP
jgi:L-aspartate oxidase